MKQILVKPETQNTLTTNPFFEIPRDEPPHSLWHAPIFCTFSLQGVIPARKTEWVRAWRSDSLTVIAVRTIPQQVSQSSTSEPMTAIQMNRTGHVRRPFRCVRFAQKIAPCACFGDGESIRSTHARTVRTEETTLPMEPIQSGWLSARTRTTYSITGDKQNRSMASRRANRFACQGGHHG